MMNYINIVKTILDTSKSHVLVNEVANGDVYEHLNSGEHKYPCVFLTVNTITQNSQMYTINGTLFYIDRLTESADNEIQIQSAGISVLGDIFNRLQEYNGEFELLANTYTVFTEKFSDLCAGVFSSFSVTFANDTCYNESNFEI